jgi:hypothetical protein
MREPVVERSLLRWSRRSSQASVALHPARRAQLAALRASPAEQALRACGNPSQSTEWSVDPTRWQGDDAVERYDWPALREARGELQTWQGFQYEVASTAKQQLAEVQAVLAILERARP